MLDGGRHGVSSSWSSIGQAGAGRLSSTCGTRRRNGRRDVMRRRCAGRRRPRGAGIRVNA
ncbi:hypothetical protein D1006_27855 [Burkholderia stabilis]|uniref:Uncharacterized protein n=1 Tax=Burkholderia stabilis TaxID=95485 RepID=A0A4Q2AKF1_9BURK|nr:hypothetical protein D1006_27855 [Burkholderia stabilis]